MVGRCMPHTILLPWFPYFSADIQLHSTFCFPLRKNDQVHQAMGMHVVLFKVMNYFFPAYLGKFLNVQNLLPYLFSALLISIDPSSLQLK